MRHFLRQPSAAVKLIAFVNVVWLLVLLSLEVILVYEYDEKGLRDIMPSLLGPSASASFDRAVDEEQRNKTSRKMCSYHMYRKYACVLVAVSPTTAPQASSDSFLPLLWFSVCCMDVLISFVLYRAAEQKRPRLAFFWLCLAAGILSFQLIILVMFSLAKISILHELPLIGFCVFRAYSLFVVHKFYKTLTVRQQIQETELNIGARANQRQENEESGEGKYKRHKRIEDKAVVSSPGFNGHQIPSRNHHNSNNNSRNEMTNAKNHSVSFAGEDLAGKSAPDLKIRKLSQVKSVNPLPVLIFK